MPPPLLALTFPGQGSQRPGMGLPWRGSPGWTLVTEASDALGRDLADLLTTADEATLRTPREAQVATLLVSLLALRSWRAAGLPAPVVVAGHSLGEYTAMVAAGALTEAAALQLVAERGEAMQSAADARPGTMAAVLGLDTEGVAAASAAARAEGAQAWPANENAPGHVVVSGTVEGVARAGELAKDAGARRVLPLPVGGAYHTPLMDTAAQRLTVALERAPWTPAAVAVVSNVDAAPHTDGFVALLGAGLTAPVRWRESVDALRAAGATTLVELGVGGVLTGLAKRCAPGVPALAVGTPDDVEAAAAALEEAS